MEVKISITKAGQLIKVVSTTEKITRAKYKPRASLSFNLPAASGLSGLFILSISRSNISFIIFPAPAVNAPAIAAKRILLIKYSPLIQMIAATTITQKVISTFIGLVILMKEVILDNKFISNNKFLCPVNLRNFIE